MSKIGPKTKQAHAKRVARWAANDQQEERREVRRAKGQATAGNKKEDVEPTTWESFHLKEFSDQEDAEFQRVRGWAAAWQDAENGDGRELAWHSMEGLRVFTGVVALSPHWANARAKPEGKQLLEAAQSLTRLWPLIEEGLRIANSAQPRHAEKDIILPGAIKAAKQMTKHVTHGLPKAEDALRQEGHSATQVYRCVLAWKRVLPLIKARRRTDGLIEQVVAGVIAENPSLEARLRLADATKNASKQKPAVNIADVIRSYWGRGGRGGLEKESRMEVAYTLARYAFNRGRDKSNKWVKDLHKFAQAARK